MSPRKFSLIYASDKQRWQVVNDHSGDVLKAFGSKRHALAAGSLSKAIGGVGIVKIRKKSGPLQGYRCYGLRITDGKRG